MIWMELSEAGQRIHCGEEPRRVIGTLYLDYKIGRFVSSQEIQNRSSFGPLAVEEWGKFHFSQVMEQGHIGGP